VRRSTAVIGAAAVGLLAVTVAGCGDDGDDESLSATTTEPADDTTSTAAPGSGDTTTTAAPAPLDSIEVTLTEIASADSPTALVTRPRTDVSYVVERTGRVRPLADGGLGDPVLDISDTVVTGGEQGLLDVEFSADGATLYVSYSVAPGGDTRVDAYTMAGDRVDAGSRREVLAVEQPFSNHNGGDVELGPDGYLYVALGDGGGGGDPEENGQDTGALLGKILRIDPSRPSGGTGYAVPADNPFVGGGGAPEVWLYGVRNPWRIAFAPGSGDLWVADVGQNAIEEIDLLPAAGGGGRGANLGWNEMEGSQPFEGGSNPEGGVLPVFEYDRDEGGCSITGGLVYRGAAIRGLAGAYLFTDYCDGRIRAIRVEGGRTVDEHTFDASGSELVSFGEDASGEVYIVSLSGPIYRLEPG
jgi:glucose/arabinose dehydrogenase